MAWHPRRVHVPHKGPVQGSRGKEALSWVEAEPGHRPDMMFQREAISEASRTKAKESKATCRSTNHQIRPLLRPSHAQHNIVRPRQQHRVLDHEFPGGEDPRLRHQAETKCAVGKADYCSTEVVVRFGLLSARRYLDPTSCPR